MLVHKRSNPCDGLDLSTVTTTYNVSDADKAKIPYTGTDTLIFKSDAGDTAILYGQGKIDYYITDQKGGGSADCPKTYKYKYENVEVDFTSTNSNLYQLSFTAFMNDMGGTSSGVLIKANDLQICGSGFDYIDSKINNSEDSIFLNSIYQKGVYIQYSSKSVLFNYTKGILKFIDSNNKTWTKLK